MVYSNAINLFYFSLVLVVVNMITSETNRMLLCYLSSNSIYNYLGLIERLIKKVSRSEKPQRKADEKKMRAILQTKRPARTTCIKTIKMLLDISSLVGVE